MQKFYRYLLITVLALGLGTGLFTLNTGSVRAATATQPTVTAQHAYLLDTSTQQPLFAKDASTRVEIASITKVMTALVVLNTGNLDQSVTILKKYRSYVKQYGASTADLATGDKLTVRELLYALMLPSGCDAAYALAEATAGSYDNFVARMNAQARAMNLPNTYFTSVDGLHLPDANMVYGYSTASEVTTIGAAAMQNPVFRDVVKTATYTLPATTTHKSYTWNNTNTLLTSYQGAVGIKTGTTSQAGPCVLFAATRNGRTLIGVALNSADVNQRFVDAATMLDWGFQQITAPTTAQQHTLQAA